jgi:hypothetical protein
MNSIYDNVFGLLDDLNNRVYTGHDAIAMVNSFILQHKEYEDLIFSIIDRNLEIRASESVINKVIPGLIPTFDVALANKFERTADIIENVLTDSNNNPLDIDGMVSKANKTYGMDPNAVVAKNFSYRGITDPTAGQLNEMAADQIEDFREKYRTGQFGPSFIEAEKPTLNRKIQDAFYSLPFLSKPQSADQIIEEGYTPGIKLGILSNLLPDKFGTLPRGDQAFIARNMGYTGPTVFGENASGLGKDPFGLNVRSALGNYAERVGKEYASLGDSLSGRLADKYGVEFDEETGMFVGSNAAKANQMTKMMRAKYNFYKQQTAQRDADRAAAKAAEEEAAAAAAKREKDFAALGRSDPNDPSRQGASGRRPGSGGTVDRVTSGPGRNVDDTGQAYDSGGREGFGYGLADGGIVSMLEIYD